MGKGGKIREHLPVLIIAVVCIVAFSPVAFLHESLKYDILDGYLPGHYFLSECLRNNIFPLWNPYQQLGYPVYADMLNTNYIIDMVLGRLFPYTNVTFHILFILYVIIAGVGAYKLALENRISSGLSLIAGIAYALSGFVTGNAQHIQFIVGAAWLPFSILYFMRMCIKPAFNNTLLFVVITFMLITGGYPSFAIMLGYGLLPVFVYFLFRKYRVKENFQAIKLLMHGALALILIALLCTGVLISIKQAAPYVERYIQLSYEYSVTNPFPPSSLISLIAPYATAVHHEMFPTDISMNNHYFGITTLIFLVYSLTLKPNKTGIFLLVTSGILLVFSFGEHGFLHRIFFNYVPLFNKFRHPASFRFITILLLLLFSGIQVSRYNPAEGHHYRRFRTVYISCIIVISIICACSSAMIILKLTGPATFTAKWENVMNDFGLFGPLFIQTLIFLVLNLPFIYLILIRKKLNQFYPLLVCMLIFEAILFTRMNMHYTVTSHYDPHDIRAFLRNSPSAFPLPDDLPVSCHSDRSVAHVPLINNTNTYSKTVSADYMYPFVLNGFRALRNDTQSFNNIVRRPLFYFENKGKGDTIICTEFGPNRMSFSVNAGGKRKAILQQNYFPGWQISLDGLETDHFLKNGTLLGTNIPEGKHVVTFAFKNDLYKKATLGAFGLFIVILLFVQIFTLSEKRISPVYPAVFSCLLIVGTAVLLLPVRSFAEINRKDSQDLMKYLKVENIDNSFLVFNTESMDPYLPELAGAKYFYKRYRNYRDLRDLWEVIDTIKSEKLIYIWSNVTEPDGLEELISCKFPGSEILFEGTRTKVIEFGKGLPFQSQGLEEYSNNYEQQSEIFSNEGIVYDSAASYSGIYSEKLSGERIYSSTFRKALDGNGIDVFAMVRFRLKNNSSGHIVLSVERKGKSVYYDAADLRDFQTDKEGWNTAFISGSFLKSTLKKGDKLVIFCWNSGNNEAIYLDDFFVKIKK